MRIYITSLLTAMLFYLGTRTLLLLFSSESRSTVGRKTIRKMSKWQRPKNDIWSVAPLRPLVSLTARIVYIDEDAALKLDKSLKRAELQITPREFTARKYIICAAGAALLAFSAKTGFYFGLILGVLGLIYGLMRQRDVINKNIKKKQLAISKEMPKFVRTICRSLQSNRDLYNVIRDYRKVAGQELGSELDILLTEMGSGNVQTALMHFETRLGTPEAFRLCSALNDMSLGIDQTATLSYMADDMARQAIEIIKKELSLRPGKMRMSYYPAIGVCILMILYVLIAYVMNNLYGLY
jgi:Flp pilus assembly protein TadB